MKNTVDNNISFKDLKTKKDVAMFLGGSLQNLSYNLYKLPEERRYKVFPVPKKSGGYRIIYAPSSSIKYYQRSIANALMDSVSMKSCVHGFAREKSIKTNALVHKNKKYVINIDLNDFFPSIHFGRVLGIFSGYPFNFNAEVATVLAQICTFEGKLPQGAPSSPIISNLVCRSLDNQLLDFAKKHKLSYTRYADDITFSTNMKKFPEGIGQVAADGILTLSEELSEIIESNDFRINSSKVRCFSKNGRQEVTGLVVNRKVNVRRIYIRRIRAMLHAWKKYELEAAAKEHFEKYVNLPILPDAAGDIFKKRVVGMIGFVGYIKGRGDSVYSGLYSKLQNIDPYFNLPAPLHVPDNKLTAPLVYCEGVTDGIHLRAALDHFKSTGRFRDLNVVFFKYGRNDKVSNGDLFAFINGQCRTGQKRRIIGLFDRDDRNFGPSRVLANGKDYKDWGNNVFSCLLPRAPHRDFNEVCIEHFYSNENLKTTDEKGRRLYLSNEFNPEDNKSLEHPDDIMCESRKDLETAYPKIIDDGVIKYSCNGKNIALSKKAFAYNIANKVGAFANVSFENFEPIFEMLDRIVKL